MREIKFCTVLFAVLTASVLFAAPKAEEIAAARLFAADYTKSQETVKAQFAKGKPDGRLLPGNRAMRFDFDVLSTTNYGLQVGKDRAGVRYDAMGNYPLRGGSIELTVKNIDWEYNAKGVHLFMQPISADLTMFVYKHSNDGIGVYVRNNKTKKSLFLRRMPKDWKSNSIHHLVYTWDGAGNSVLYLDGLMAAKGFIEFPETPVKYFCVGSTGRFGASGQTAIGHVRIYDRALTDKEVIVIAGELIPELKKKGLQVIKETIMQPSPWFKNKVKLGMAALDGDYVPQPFQPVAVKGKTLSVWARNYDFSGSGVLDQVTANNEKLLRKSVNLTINGKELELKKYQIVKQQKGRVEFTKTAANAELKGTFEYDGMVHCRLTLKPEKPVEELTLRIPMTKEASEILHFVGATDRIGGDYGPSSPKGSNTITLPTTPGTVWTKRFGTHTWLGSTRSGLQFFVGSEQYCYPRKRQDLLEIVRNDDGSADLLVKMIVKPLPDNAPKEFTLDFGFIATPVKALPDNWRAMTMSAQYDAFTGKTRGGILVYWPDEWAQISLDPEPHRGLNKGRTQAKVKIDRASGRKIVPYWDRRHLPISQKNKVNPDAEAVYEAWSPDPQRSRAGRFDWMRCAGTSEWADYMVWCIDQWNEVFGTIDGAYIDEMILDPNKNAVSGGGYTDFDGERRPTYSWLADRNLYKRIHYVIAQRNGNLPPWSIAHCSATSMMEILSPFTVFLTGEHLYSGYFPDDKDLNPPAGNEVEKYYYYSYSLPMERVRGEFYHRQWGAVIAWLPCLKNKRDIMEHPTPTRDLMSRIMHADVIFWPLWCNKQEVYKVDEIRRQWDIGNKAVKFIPYWENKVLTASAPNVVISYYDKNGEKLAIVSNLARKNQAFDIVLPKTVKSVINAETGKVLPVVKGKVKVDIKRNDFGILIIK